MERFLKYVKIETTSSETSGTSPSSDKEFTLAQVLRDELQTLGLSDVVLDDHCYVYASIPATKGYEAAPVYGLIAHMDTSPAVSGAGVNPQVIRYEGGDIHLLSGDVISERSYPFLKNYIGRDLIVTDGRTLLGADDKAGVAEIVSAAEYLLSHPEIPHGKVAIAFTPDEEIGEGVDHFDLERFGADYAYTVDGGALGELEYENFNAASALVSIRGLNIHPGSAKDKMKNAVLLAADFISMLPPAETPAHTEGYEGFYHVAQISGDESSVEISMIVRDHDRAKFEARKTFLQNLTTYLNGIWGEGTFTLKLRDSYYNMKEMIEPHMHLIDRAKAALEAEGLETKICPIRGGTDGARLSYMGLPCPNLCTGGENYHSIHEFIPADAIGIMTRVLVRLVTV